MGRPTRRAPDPDDETHDISVENAPEATVDGLVQPRTMQHEPEDDDPAEKVIIDLGDDPKPPTPIKQRVTPHRRVQTPHDISRRAVPSPSRDADALPVGHTWIVALVYFAAAAALGISIYWRFLR